MYRQGESIKTYLEYLMQEWVFYKGAVYNTFLMPIGNKRQIQGKIARNEIFLAVEDNE